MADEETLLPPPPKKGQADAELLPPPPKKKLSEGTTASSLTTPSASASGTPSTSIDHKEAYQFYSDFKKQKADRENNTTTPATIKEEASKNPSTITPDERPYFDALAKNPKDSKAANDLGAIYLHEGKTLDASNTFLNSIENNPSDAASRVGYSHILNQQKDYKSAIKHLDVAIQLTPQNAMAWTERAYAKSKLGDKEGALKDASTAEMLDPNNSYHNKLKSAILAKSGKNDLAVQEKLKADQKEENAQITGQKEPLQGDSKMPFGLPSNDAIDANSTPEELEYNQGVRNQLKMVDWFESGGVKGGDDSYASKMMGFLLNPIGALAETASGQIEAGAKDIMEGAKKGAFMDEESSLAGNLKMVKGLSSILFGGMTATPGGAAFVGGLNAAPETAQKYIMAPVTSFFEPKTDMGKDAAGIVDIFANLLAIHGINKGAGKVVDVAKDYISGKGVDQASYDVAKQYLPEITKADFIAYEDMLSYLPKDITPEQRKGLTPKLLDLMQLHKQQETATSGNKIVLDAQVKAKENEVKDDVNNIILKNKENVSTSSSSDTSSSAQQQAKRTAGKGSTKQQADETPGKEGEPKTSEADKGSKAEGASDQGGGVQGGKQDAPASSRDRVNESAVEDLAKRIVSGEKIESPEDLQLQANYPKELETEIKKQGGTNAIPKEKALPLDKKENGKSDTNKNIVQEGERKKPGINREAEENASKESENRRIQAADAWLESIAKNDIEAQRNAEKELIRQSDNKEGQGESEVLANTNIGGKEVRASGDNGKNVGEKTTEVRTRSSQESQRTGQQGGKSGTTDGLSTLENAPRGEDKGILSDVRLLSETEKRTVVNEVRALSEMPNKENNTRSARALQKLLRESSPEKEKTKEIIELITKTLKEKETALSQKEERIKHLQALEESGHITAKEKEDLKDLLKESKKPETPPANEDYRGQHQIKNPPFTADKITEAGGHEDFFENPSVNYDLSDPAYKESYRALKGIKDNPDAEVTVYRAVPKGVDKINEGDWVSLSKTYAKQHGLDAEDASKDMPVISMKVKAKNIGWDGNDINEFSYNPKTETPSAEQVKETKSTTDGKEESPEEKGQEKNDGLLKESVPFDKAGSPEPVSEEKPVSQEKKTNNIGGYEFTDMPTLTEADGLQVKKLSDSESKNIGEQIFLTKNKKALRDGVTSEGDGWYSYDIDSSGNKGIYNDFTGEAVELKHKKGGRMGVVISNFLENNPRELPVPKEAYDKQNTLIKDAGFKGVDHLIQSAKKYLGQDLSKAEALKLDEGQVKELKGKVDEVKAKESVSQETATEKPPGKEIEPNKKVSASKAKAIEEIAPNYSLKPMEASILHSLKDKSPDDIYNELSDEKTMKGAIAKKLVERGLLNEDWVDGKTELTDKAKQFISAVDARLETRKAVKAGTDLFPEDANIAYRKAVDSSNKAWDKVGQILSKGSAKLPEGTQQSGVSVDAIVKAGKDVTERAIKAYFEAEKVAVITKEKLREIVDRVMASLKKVYGEDLTEEHEQKIKDALTEGIPTGELTEEEKGKQESPIAGVSNRVMQEIADRFGINAPESGKVMTTEEQVDLGQALLKEGADAQKVVDDYNSRKVKSISTEEIAIGRAHAFNLEKEANKAQDNFDKNPSKENKEKLKEAAQKLEQFQKDYQPMKSKWAEIGKGFQGEQDIDTGTVSGLRKAVKEDAGRDLTKSEEEKATELAKKVQDYQEDRSFIEKIHKEHDEAVKEGAEKQKRTYTQRAKKAADTFRKLKTKPFVFKDSNGNVIQVHQAGISWNDLIETGAKAIEATGKVADGISAVIDQIKDTDWYKNFTDDDKKNFENQLTDHFTNQLPDAETKYLKSLNTRLEKLQEADEVVPRKKIQLSEEGQKEADAIKAEIKKEHERLGVIDAEKKTIDLKKRFVDKNDLTFTPQDAKDVWNHAAEYIDQGKDFGEAVYRTANDLGLSPDQVRSAIDQPKNAKSITDEMYMRQRKRKEAMEDAKAWVRSRKYSGLTRGLMNFNNFQFIKTVFGHGTVSMLTHGGTLAFDPRFADQYYPIFLKQYKMFVSSDAAFEKLVEDFERDPMYAKKLQAGLKIEPEDTKTDDYLLGGKSNKNNIFAKISRQGNKGFFAIKLLRSARFDFHYDRLTDAEKQDPEALKSIASLANYETGTVGGRAPGWTNWAFFAPKLKASNWMGGVVAPIKTAITGARVAANTYTKLNWRDATTAEKVYAKTYAQKAGWTVATYVGALAINQAILSMSDSDEKINFFDPSKSDFMAFKGKGKTVGLTSGLLATYHFIGTMMGIFHESFTGTKGRAKSPEESIGSKLVKQVRYMESPGVGLINDFVFGVDVMGRPLPAPYHRKPEYKDQIPYGKAKPFKGTALGWAEYVAANQLPIPVSDGIKTTIESMRDNGMSKQQVTDYLKGLAEFAVVGFTGARVQDDYKQKFYNPKWLDKIEESSKHKTLNDLLK